MIKRVFILSLTIIMFMVLACKPKASTTAVVVAQGLKVSVKEATKGSVENRLSLSGIIEPWEQVMVFVKFPGKLIQKNVEEGQIVVKDQVLAYVNIDEIGMESNNYEVKAPLAGIVAMINFDPGSLVAPSAPLMVIMNTDTVKTTVHVIESEIGEVHKGVRATISVPAYPKRTFYGTVSSVHPIVDPMSHTTKIEVQINNRDHTLKPGMSATVVLSLGRHDNVVTVPKDAIIEKLGETYVFLYNNGLAKKSNIQTGYDDGSRVEILQGVNAGDKIITTDINVLINDTKVQVREEK
jgi:multidrug efflux pump subunit AcrA (membrane-fusion protein)